jgi:uncharacterized protein
VELTTASAFGIGLAGAGHCLGMCGGIAAALNLGQQQRLVSTCSYHAGRILSYTLLGALAGLAAGSIGTTGWPLVLRYIAGLLLIGMGLYIADWWRGMQWLERGGALLWRPVQRYGQRLLPIRHWYQAAALGLLWGLMPCGLIYSSLAWAATAGDAATSAWMMLCFGLGTLPAMLATSLGAQQLQNLLRRRGLKLLIALLLVAAGAWTLYQAGVHGAHVHQSADAPHQHGHH